MYTFWHKRIIAIALSELTVDSIAEWINVSFFSQYHWVLIASLDLNNAIFREGKRNKLRDMGIRWLPSTAKLAKVACTPGEQTLILFLFTEYQTMRASSLNPGNLTYLGLLLFEKLNFLWLTVSRFTNEAALPFVRVSRKLICSTPRP